MPSIPALKCYFFCHFLWFSRLIIFPEILDILANATEIKYLSGKIYLFMKRIRLIRSNRIIMYLLTFIIMLSRTLAHHFIETVKAGDESYSTESKRADEPYIRSNRIKQRR